MMLPRPSFISAMASKPMLSCGITKEAMQSRKVKQIPILSKATMLNSVITSLAWLVLLAAFLAVLMHFIVPSACSYIASTADNFIDNGFRFTKLI